MKFITLMVKGIILFFISTVLIFFIIRLMPVTPQEMLLTSYQMEHSKENILFLTEKWGLDKPIYVQYLKWISAILIGDWGRSLITNEPIRDELLRRLPYSITIGMGSLFLSSLYAFVLGYLAALKKGIFDLISRIITLLSQGIPFFISSLVLIYILDVHLHWIKFFTANPWIGVVICMHLLALSTCGELSRVVRIHFLELEDKLYIKRLYVQGMRKWKIYLKHGFKPVMYGLISALVPRFSSVIGGSSVGEFVFAIPGVSYYLIDSIKNRDYTSIQAYLFLMLLWMVCIQFIFHILRIFLDKRLKL